MEHLEGLNPAQREAATHTDGALLVVAGAGTGKTKTITHRVAHLIHSGIAGHNILAITFTNKAAGELKERVSAITPTWATHPRACTFHSFGVSLLREYGDRIGLKKTFSIASAGEARTLIKNELKTMGYTSDMADPKKIAGIISQWKNAGRKNPPEHAPHPMADIAARVWRGYEQSLRASQLLDFDDLLRFPVALLAGHADIQEAIQTRYTHIHVDEYQDTNTIQNKLIRLLTRSHGNICAVGDSDQTIYTWRGAQIENILRFTQDYPDAHTIILETNYRSTPTIVRASNALVAHNKNRTEKNLISFMEEGGDTPSHETAQITIGIGDSEYDEARWVAERVSLALSCGTPASSIAVLFRAHFLSRVLEEVFIEHDIPYSILGTRFFERSEIQDIIAYIHIIYARLGDSDPHPIHLARALKTPKRGIGKVSLLNIVSGNAEKLTARARASWQTFSRMCDTLTQHASTSTPSELIEEIFTQTGITDILQKGSEDDLERLDNLRELVSFASRFDTHTGISGIEQFLEHVALMSDQDTQKTEAQTVSLMTIHASKGLEFDTVFIVGLEEGIFPSSHDGQSSDTQKEGRDGEEERRLMYVAMTRAQRKLFLSYAHTRTIFGSRSYQLPSRFLEDIPDTFMRYDGEDSLPRIKKDLLPIIE